MTTIVSTFAPIQDGIARYADQQVTYLRRQGEEVFKIGLPGSDADVVLDAGTRMPGRLARLLQQRGRTVIHWQDVYFFHGGARQRIVTTLGWYSLYRRCPQVEVLCHEAGLVGRPRDAARKVLHAVDTALRRRMWRAAPRVILHSEAERSKLEQRLGVRLEDKRVSYLPHGQFLSKEREINREEARAELGLAAQTPLFLCIGFLGEQKGFHRALEAFTRLPPGLAQLCVVGRSLYDTPEAQGYVMRLRRLVDAAPGATLVEQYVSDAVFDTWIAASDFVLTPYANAFSSSVAERAKLYERPLIASGVGGLGHQLTPRDHLFTTDEEMSRLMLELARSVASQRASRDRAPAFTQASKS